MEKNATIIFHIKHERLKKEHFMKVQISIHNQSKNLRALFLLSAALFASTISINAQTQLEKQSQISQSSTYFYHATNNFPDEISFCIADIKFDGTAIKICEFGEGIESRFKGYEALHHKGSMWAMLWAYLKEFNLPIWFIGRSSQEYDTTSLRENGVKITPNLYSIEAQEDFKQAVKNSKKQKGFCQSSGIIAARTLQVHSSVITNFKEKHPEMIVLGQATNKFVRSKYHTSTLFDTNKLAAYKPKFKICTKRYSSTLAQSIIDELGCEIYVIKPIDSALGNGVLLVEKENLDDTLRIILKDRQELESFKSDMSYYHWKRDEKEFFIVEEYAPSKTLYVNGKPYDPTMRVIFSMHNKAGNIVINFFDAYWKLPIKSLDQEGTLTEKHKSRIGSNLTCSMLVDYTDFEMVKALLSKALPKLYLKMLESSFPLQ